MLENLECRSKSCSVSNKMLISISCIKCSHVLWSILLTYPDLGMISLEAEGNFWESLQFSVVDLAKQSVSFFVWKVKETKKLIKDWTPVSCFSTIWEDGYMKNKGTLCSWSLKVWESTVHLVLSFLAQGLNYCHFFIFHQQHQLNVIVKFRKLLYAFPTLKAEEMVTLVSSKDIKIH